MTTTNGGSQGRITQTVAGTIAAANERGVRLLGEQEWRNWSRWADKPAEAPAPGQRVRLGLDASGYIRELHPLDDAPTAPASSAPTARDREIRRLACLTAAAAFCAGKCVAGIDVKSTDVLAIAEAWERWVEQEAPSDD
jgi:hypothetical protein